MRTCTVQYAVALLSCAVQNIYCCVFCMAFSSSYLSRPPHLCTSMNVKMHTKCACFFRTSDRLGNDPHRFHRSKGIHARARLFDDARAAACFASPMGGREGRHAGRQAGFGRGTELSWRELELIDNLTTHSGDCVVNCTVLSASHIDATVSRRPDTEGAACHERDTWSVCTRLHPHPHLTARHGALSHPSKRPARAWQKQGPHAQI